MHKAPEECHQFTTIGLIIEGIYAFFGPMVFILIILRIHLLTSINYPQEFMAIFTIFIMLMSTILLVFPVIFIVNLILFRKLLKQRVSSETAASIYLYQIIYGVIALFSVFALLPGIFYLLSGIQGRMSIRGTIL